MKRTDPHHCPLRTYDDDDPQLCPHRRYPECYANAPPEVRAVQHISTCGKGLKCPAQEWSYV